jgi:hypothetical protein
MSLAKATGRVEYRPGRWSRVASWVTAGALISLMAYGEYQLVPTANSPYEVGLVVGLVLIALLFAYVHFRWIRCFVVADEVGLIVGDLRRARRVQWDEIRSVVHRPTKYGFVVLLELAGDRQLEVPALEQPNWFDTRARRRVFDVISDELERRAVAVRAD